jgi:hypothetical protein
MPNGHRVDESENVEHSWLTGKGNEDGVRQGMDIDKWLRKYTPVKLNWMYEW